MGIVTDAERKCCMWSNEKCFGVTECEMTGLGTTHAGCTCPALLGEVENFGNGTFGQDENHLSTRSQHYGQNG